MAKKIKNDEEIKTEKQAVEEVLKEYKERSKPRRKKKIKRENKENSPLFLILVNLVFLYILNNKSFQNTSLIAKNFNLCLPMVNLFLSAKIIGSLLIFLNDSVRFRSVVSMFLNLLGLVTAYILYKIFPFNLPAIASFNGGVLVRAVLFLAMIGTGVAVIVEFFKAIFNTADWK
ncbi:hypothetical protein COT64_03675 [Candidatus Shapirobacteria bacterium CG09_land_8_20_14_0_10_39_12]|uniref:Uncharacterized protein n=1 Tax=Candidatus Shapirobacteria bacterium CG09_land_8_20_14_0_10_39_12 TaxID=1974885 RepID=A0A2H0WQQ8_9BACT|nr:MAG: hypothetical protein COT64_03675 [Candidatus Shapirobacteria bacterium CG09_land_8_20_14_0_10_39_12]